MEEVKVTLSDSREGKNYLTRFWHVPAQNINFTGRKKLLNQMGERLSYAKPLVITACYGLGGVGKTQLVTEYAHRNQDKYERVLWIPSENAEQIETAYLSLGQDLRIIPDKIPPAEAIAMVKAWLSNHPRNLVIFDNVPDYQTVEPYILPEGADVLITSRHAEWPEKGVEVDVFSLDEAVEYYLKIVGIREEDSREKIEKLAKKLGRLPLALAQAAAYIRENQISLDEYLDLYKKKKAILLSKALLPENEEHVAVYVTWDVTMEKIKEKSTLAPVLLNVCSYLHSENIPSFLLEPICEDERFNPEKKELFEEARGCLSGYSMVTVNETDDSVSVHRLVQEVTQLKLDEKEKTRCLESIFNLCVACFPYGEDKDSFNQIFIKRVLLPHFRSLLNFFEKPESKLSQLNVLENRFVTLTLYLADAFNAIGEFSHAKLMLDELLVMIEGEDKKTDDILAEIFVGLSIAFGGLRQLPLQKHYIEKALERVSEPFRTANLNMLLANVYGDMGELVPFLSILESKVLPGFISTVGEESIYVARAKGNIANIYGIRGEVFKQRNILDEIIPCYRKHYGKDHPLYANVFIALSQTYAMPLTRKTQRYYLEKALKIRKSFFGESHGLIGHVLINLSNTYVEQEEIPEAKKLLENALRIFEEFYGNEHFDVALALMNLSDIDEQLGDREAQVQRLEKALVILRMHFNNEHMFVLYIFKTLGKVRGIQGQFDEALSDLLQVYACKENEHVKSFKEFLLLYLSAVEFERENHEQSLFYLGELLGIQDLDRKYLGIHDIFFNGYIQHGCAFVLLEKLECAIRLGRDEECWALIRGQGESFVFK